MGKKTITTTTQIPLKGVARKEYRGRNEIITTILSTIKDSGNDGATRSHVMYKSFLSHTQLKEYLSFLIESGNVDEIHEQAKNGNEKLVYKITDNGSRLLHIIQEVECLVVGVT